MNRKQQAAGLVLALVLLAFVLPAEAQDAPPPPVVRLEVNPQTANAGDTITVAVRLENVTELYGLQVTCLTDPTLLAGTMHVEGDAFTSGSSYYVNTGMKPDGKWLVAATRLQPNPAFSGNGTAFTFQYTLQNATSASLNCTILGVDSRSNPLPLNLVNATPMITAGVLPTAEVPTAEPTLEPTLPPTVEVTVEPTLEVTPEPTSVAIGLSSIQGSIVNPLAADNAGVVVQLTANGSLVQEGVTGADGVFSFAEIPAGSYVLLVSAPSHLALVYNITVAGDGAAIDLGSQTFIIGDTDGNQIIDVADAALVSANFDVTVPPAPTAADLNGDGVINISDLVLIGTNFGLSGPIVVQ
ncbi:MAG: carboxypeptidase regulatory-like domain-containing protein [Chloroflexi bacterium]|nr:carboxypeptidase regulatory-like domain-containing protein [Chloroflexota bacterium]MCC6892957.1 carboxypeptidase regulatory-like domain-containing protein [Anaerolineae bacterium]